MAWYGVDFDGTLCVYGGPREGQPVPAMVERVQRWLRSGKEVRIVTARVASSNPPEDVARERARIESWCAVHIGQALPVTAEKDYGMLELWDDRAVTVKANTGEVLTR
jgi:hypothetical protein